MARRRNQDENQSRFTTGEVAKATGLQVRSVIYLCDLGVLPAEGGGSMGTHRELGVEALVRAAITSAFYRSGIDVAKAARLVEALCEDEDIGKKIAKAGLSYILELTLGENRKIDVPDEYPLEDAYYLHKYINKKNAYKRGSPYRYDQIIEIQDGSRVAITHLNEKEGEFKTSDTGAVLFTMKHFEKNANAVEFKFMDLSPFKKLRNEVLRGYVWINASLASRDALDNIADMRE